MGIEVIDYVSIASFCCGIVLLITNRVIVLKESLTKKDGLLGQQIYFTQLLVLLLHNTTTVNFNHCYGVVVVLL